MIDLLELAQMENDDAEFVPEILSVNARISIKGPVAKLLALFDRAASVAPTKETLPGTMFSLLEAFHTTETEVAHVRITASDGEQSVSVVADGLQVLTAGAVLLPAKRLSDILKLAPSPDVRFEVMGTTAVVRSGRAQWSVQTPAGDSLSTVPDVEGISGQSVAVSAFLSALTTARRSASATAARSSLMQVSVRNGSITGCDGGRLHRAFIEGFDTSANFTIPIKAVDELLKALRTTNEEYFSVGYDDRHLVFQIDNDSIVAQRLLVDFPDVEPLLLGPAFSNKNSLTLDTKELAAIVKRVRVNADPDYAAIFLGIVPGPKDAENKLTWTLAVRTRDRSGNTSQEVMPVQWEGSSKQRELCLNHHYLSDFLASYPSEYAVFKVGDDTKTSKTPLFLEDIERGFTGIIQQMRSDWI